MRPSAFSRGPLHTALAAEASRRCQRRIPAKVLPAAVGEGSGSGCWVYGWFLPVRCVFPPVEWLGYQEWYPWGINMGIGERRVLRALGSVDRGWPWPCVWGHPPGLPPDSHPLPPRRQRVPALWDLLPALQQHQGLPHLQLRQELHEDRQYVQGRRSGGIGGLRRSCACLCHPFLPAQDLAQDLATLPSLLLLLPMHLCPPFLLALLRAGAGLLSVPSVCPSLAEQAPSGVPGSQ